MDKSRKYMEKTKPKTVKFPKNPVVAVKTYTPSSKGSSPFLRREFNETSPQYKQRVELAKQEDQEARGDFVKDYAKSLSLVPASLNIPSKIANLKEMKLHVTLVETHAIQQKKLKPKTVHTHRRAFATANSLKHGWAMQSIFWDKRYLSENQAAEQTKKKSRVQPQPPIQIKKVVSILSNIFSPRKK